MQNMVFFHVGWMKCYEGVDDDKIHDGGEFVNENGYGFEIYNYHEIDGKVYGYVESGGYKKGSREIHIERLGAARNDYSISDILVVWTATHPKGGIYIIGWYKNATVYRHSQDASNMPDRMYKDKLDKDIYLEYNAVAKATDAKLLPENERTFRIPRGKGGKGHSNLWYCDDPSTAAIYRDDVLKYIKPKEIGKK
jgi:hypothetical protein